MRSCTRAAVEALKAVEASLGDEALKGFEASLLGAFKAQL